MDTRAAESSEAESHQAQDLADWQQWLHVFEKSHGRALRVLHIGNIANNAYNNAKIQRDRGIDADVLSFDYYHIMACPEWEDADFSGEVGDEYFPDWWAVDLKDFRRPRWFAAGPLDACIRYLLAKTANRRSAAWLWWALTLELWLLCRRGWLHRMAQGIFHRFAGRCVTYDGAPANSLLMSLLGRWLRCGGEVALVRTTRLGKILRWKGRRLLRMGRTADVTGDKVRHLRAMARYLPKVKHRWTALFTAIGRDDPADALDYYYERWWHPYMPLLLRRYDIVQCYATYTAIPFIINRADYVSYEHGTIRTIPFSLNTEGRMCMASYRAAAAVFITNIDNLDAAQKMQLDPQRVICLPHAFDSDKLLRFASTVAGPQSDVHSVVTFVMPARQHWVDNDPGWAKGNDRVFAGLRLLKDQKRHCVLRAVAWGNDLSASRARLSELGIEDMVEWLPTMKKRELWGEYLKAHAVIDQFVVAAFGGISFEAMTLGRRVLTNIDDERAVQFFGATPPLFSCRSVEDIAAAMIRVIDDPTDALGYGRANQEWVLRYHSADRIVALQTNVYRRMVESKGQKLHVPRVQIVDAHKLVDSAASHLETGMRKWLRSIRPFYVARPWVRTTGGNEIVMLVVSALRIDPRVEREARALAAAGWRVRIIAPDISAPSLVVEPLDWGSAVSFHLLPLEVSGYVMEAPWLVSEEMYEAAMAFKPFAYHCHDLNTALIGLRAASKVGARCVCDFHEWSSENVTWSNEHACWEPHDPQKRVLLQWAERLALSRADEVITVNQSIARELELLGRSPPGRVKIIRNIPSLNAPPTRAYPSIKTQLGLPEDSFVVLYQGGTGPTRLLEPVIEALALAPQVTLVIRGPSLDLFGEGYRAVARLANVENRVILADPVPSRDVVAAALGADAGLWTLPNLSKNFYLALPNKIFEYLASGLPLLVAEFPEARRIVEEGGVGLCFNPYDPASIAGQMNRFVEDRSFAAHCRAAVPHAFRDLQADAEWERFANIYAQLR